MGGRIGVAVLVALLALVASAGAHAAPPASPIFTAVPPTVSPSSTATISFEPGDLLTLSYVCSLDGAAFFADCPSDVLLENLADGDHTFAVKAVNASGERSAAVATAWSVDTSNPQTALDGTPALRSKSSSATLAFSSPNNAATFECSLDGSAFQTCTNPVTHLSLTDDTHVFSVRAVNAVGTRDPMPAAWIWLVDTVAPDTNLVSAPSGTLDLRNVAVSFTSNDSGAGFECRLNSGAFAACTSPVDYSGLTDGAHVVVVRAVDLAGNVDASPAGATFAVDAPPETSIVAGPAGSIATSTASFVLGSSTPSDTFECSLNGAPYVVCSSPLQVIGIAPGTHALLVRAVDLGGERDPTPASSTWTVVQLAATPSAFAANVRKAGVKPGDHRATLTWRRPRDADFHHVEIVRVPGKKKKARSLVYKGNKIAFVDKGLKNGVQYTWFVYAADKKGNRSGGVKLKATSPVQVRLGKKLRVVPQAPILFSWNPRKKARFYNVQLFRGKRKVLSSWPVKSTVSLSGPWNWEGRKRKLVAGNYEWFVWPGFGKRADSNFGKLIGSGKLVVKNPKAAGAKKKKKK